MIISTKDISAFIYCPYFKYKHNKNNYIYNTLTPFEECVVNAIKSAEKDCLIKDREITSKKIIRHWDNFWWPAIAKNNIPIKKAQNIAIKAANIFVDYCNYEFAGFLYPTIGVNIPSSLKIGQSILETNTDILKINLDIKEKNLHIISFGNINKSIRQLSLDPEIRSLVYSLYYKYPVTIAYTYLYLKENNKRIEVNTVVFRRKDMIQIRKMLNYTEQGIRTGINTMNLWNCEECKQCKSLK